MTKTGYDIGMIGLGTMGANLAFNMADHGFSVIGHDQDAQKVQAFASGHSNVAGAANLDEMVAALKRPRAIMMLVPAGGPVDQVANYLSPLLERGDILMDGGNSHFIDTNRRIEELARWGVQFLGVGISGGEDGARHGPSIMPGGSSEGYGRVAPILEAIAARVNDQPCVSYLGPGSAGHYVKMIHNGIEYGLMRLIAETYDLMKRGLDYSNDDLADVYERWNGGSLGGFLVEITSAIFRREDERTGRRLIDVILDEARQKGTGMWASQNAMDLHVPAPTIDIAVAMRDLSEFKAEREVESCLLPGPSPRFAGKATLFVSRLENALYSSMIIAYAQGMALLAAASEAYRYNLSLETVARIWRGGCIIRSSLLEKVRQTFARRPNLPNLLLEDVLAGELQARQKDLRAVVATSAELGIPTPGFMSCLAYLDSYRSDWSPANLIQAQRDYFGAHTYQRIDAEGAFHTDWSRR